MIFVRDEYLQATKISLYINLPKTIYLSRLFICALSSLRTCINSILKKSTRFNHLVCTLTQRIRTYFKLVRGFFGKCTKNNIYLRMNQSGVALVFRCSLFRVVLLLVSNTFLDPKVCFPGKLKRFWGASSRAYLVWQVLGVYKHPLAGVGAENLFDGSHVHSHPAHVTPVL